MGDTVGEEREAGAAPVVLAADRSEKSGEVEVVGGSEINGHMPVRDPVPRSDHTTTETLPTATVICPDMTMVVGLPV